MYYTFQLIAFFTTFLFVSSFVVIGNYSELNLKDCGLSAFSPKVDTDCFEWHKDVLPKILDGRNTTFGEAPWTCYMFSLQVNWTKQALEPSYVFMAFDYENDFVASKYQSVERHIHPNYTFKKFGNFLYDIALVKLNKDIDVGLHVDILGEYFFENNICLPEKMERLPHDMKSYAMSAGYGSGNIITENRNLQIGYWKITNEPNFTKIFVNSLPDEEIKLIVLFRKLDGQKVCQGDSGGPVWQVHMGRAVQVGILSKSYDLDNITECQKDVYKGMIDFPIFMTWVPFYIDWIKNLTGLV